MNRWTTISRSLIGIAAGLILALLIAPQTCWIVKYQMTAVVTPMPLDQMMGVFSGSSDSETAQPHANPYASLTDRSAQQQYARAARRHPNDYQLQIAEAWVSSLGTGPVEWEQSGPRMVTAFRALRPRFPDNPSLCANILRAATDKDVTFHREEDSLLRNGSIPASRHNTTSPAPTPAALAAFDQDADMGEKLDPNNAYFPYMRAVGYFAAHRDAEGIAAILRAGKKTEWREYQSDIVTGMWRLLAEATGNRTAFARAVIQAGQLFPQLGSMRATARVAIYKAMLDEQGAQREQGLAIRQAVMHSALLMSFQSTTLIEGLVGLAIYETAALRPGAAPPYHNDSTISEEQNREKRFEAFYTYLQKIGHPDDVSKIQQEVQQYQQFRTLFQHMDMVWTPTVLLANWNAGDLLLLSNALWLIILSAAALICRKLPKTWTGRVLTTEAARWSFMIALFTLTSGLVLYTAINNSSLLINNPTVVENTWWRMHEAVMVQLVTWFAIVTVLLIGIAKSFSWSLAMFRRAELGAFLVMGAMCLSFAQTPPPFLPGLLNFIMVIGAPPILLIVLLVRERKAWRAWLPGAGYFITAMLGVLILLLLAGVVCSGVIYWIAIMSTHFGPNTDPRRICLLIVSASVVQAPVLLAISIVNLKQREPLLKSIIDLLPTIAVPAACVLVLLYGVCMFGTLRQEQRVNYGLDRSVQSEGRYLAEQLHQPWPFTAK